MLAKDGCLNESDRILIELKKDERSASQQKLHKSIVRPTQIAGPH